MKKVYIILLLVGMAIIAATVGVFYYINKPIPKTADVATDLSVNVSDFVKEVQADPAKARSKYSQEGGVSKFAEIKCVVKNIEENPPGRTHIFSETGNAKVQFSMEEDQNAAVKALQPGTEVRIKGQLISTSEPDEILGDTLWSIKLNRCILIK